MDGVMDIIKELLHEEKYDKITEISLLVFILLAPSFSLIFLFKREVFYELDLIKLLILCLIINFLGVAIIYFLDYMLIFYKRKFVHRKINEYESEIEIVKTLDDGPKKDDKLMKLHKKLDPLYKYTYLEDKGYVFKLVVIKVFSFVGYIWTGYLFSVFSLSSNKKMSSIIFGVIVVYSLLLIIEFIKVIVRVKDKFSKALNFLMVTILLSMLIQSLMRLVYTLNLYNVKFLRLFI